MPNLSTSRKARLTNALVILLVGLLGLIACAGPASTPVVIEDNSRQLTITALAYRSPTPSGPTLTPSPTSTPYTRPTDSPSLDLALPIARIGQETLTLGQFRARVRYERFAALDDVRRIVEQIGFAQLQLNQANPNPVSAKVASVFSTLANSGAFGVQVYDILVRESVIRQEYQVRGLKLNQAENDAYWIRRFGLQQASDPQAALKSVLEAYLDQAARYSSLDRTQILSIADSYTMAVALRQVIGRERVQMPDILSFRIQRLVTATRAAAEAALALLNAGETFRVAACRYSTDPAVRGTGGDLGFVTRGAVNLPLDDFTPLLNAESGSIVGPAHSAIGWFVIKVNETRRSGDGDPQIRVQAINVATEGLATQIRTRALAGEDFGALACEYSLSPVGSSSDPVFVGESTLAPEVRTEIRKTEENRVFGPIQTTNGFEIIKVLERKVDIPRPADLDKEYDKAFADWQAEQKRSNRVVSLSEAWRDAIPTDPLPRDVAPFLTESNFGLPTPVATETPRP